MKIKNVVISILAAESVLLVPLVAMIFSNSFDWDLADFVLGGILLAGIGLAFQLIVVGYRSRSFWAAAGALLALALSLVWAELAVGIFD